jgi:DNA mismatch repair protein MutS2
MNEKTLRVLEYPKVLEKLASYTSFNAGRELAQNLTPSNDLAEVQARLDTTTEARNLIENSAEVTIGGARDVRNAVRLAALGHTIDAISFLEIQATLHSSRTLRHIIMKQATQYYLLSEIARNLVDLPLLEGEIERTIAPDGSVMDSASPALRRIREQIRISHGRLIDRLNSMLTSSQYRTALQEPIITMREGRYVLPIKTDFKGQVRGIIHDQSASGQTLYIEPIGIVDLNNNWKQLQLDEKDEIERILRELAAKVAVHAPAIMTAVEALGQLDLAFAKARYANAIRATQPIISPPGDNAALLNFGQARHPLLGDKVVPIDVYLGGDVRVLVITGPNTGGKTVSIKTVGLLTLMTQAGMHIPAETGSQALIFQKIFADIGDEQSIEQSLSTFSSHMTNIIGILDKIDPATLVILDELGAGTDPTEGAALARSLIEFMLEKKACAVITTHYSELKTYAYTTPGVQNASVEFNVETLSPTYRLQIGLPGRSNALAIANRLGMPENITDGARSLLSKEETQADVLIGEIYKERETAATIRYDTMRIKVETEKLREELNNRLRSIEESRRKAITEARESARQEIETEFAALRKETDELRHRLLDIEQAARLAADSNEIAAEMERQRRALAEAERIAADLQREARQRARQRANAPLLPTDEPLDNNFKVGDAVRIESLGLEGTINANPDSEGKFEVISGNFKVKVLPLDLRKISKKTLSESGGARTSRQRIDLANQREKEAAINVNIQARRSTADTSMELDMRGWRAEEVATELDRYLNDAYMSNLPYVRLVHGKGTGVLRQVVRQYLRSHPLVASWRNGENSEGGDGVTVANLKQA